MAKQYKNPPLVEATCEIHFARDTPWDLGMIGLIYEEVKKSFSVRQPIEKSAGSEVEAIIPSRTSGFDMQFWRKDKRAYMQVGAHVLTISVLKPYSSWVRFRRLILKGLTGYRNIAQPTGINHIILRYTNQFSIPSTTSNTADYFQFLPSLIPGPNTPKALTNFIVGIEAPFEEGRDILRTTLATIPSSDSDGRAAQLDLEYLSFQHEAASFGDINSWLNTAHDRIEEMFEAVTTPQLRATFDDEEGVN